LSKTSSICPASLIQLQLVTNTLHRDRHMMTAGTTLAW